MGKKALCAHMHTVTKQCTQQRRHAHTDPRYERTCRLMHTFSETNVQYTHIRQHNHDWTSVTVVFMKHWLRKDCIRCDYRCELGGILTFLHHSYEEKATTAVPLRKSSLLFTRILFRNLFLVSINLSQGHFVFTRFFCLPLGLLSGLQKEKLQIGFPQKLGGTVVGPWWRYALHSLTFWFKNSYDFNCASAWMFQPKYCHKESLTENKKRVSYLISLTFHSVDLAENQKAALSWSRGDVVMLVPSTVGEDLHYLVS